MQDQTPRASSGFDGWWRWPLVPFASVLGALLAAMLFLGLQSLAMNLRGVNQDGWLYLYILPLAQSLLFGWIYSSIACYVAPRAKVVTGVVMVTLLGALMAVVLLRTWLEQPLDAGEAVKLTIHVAGTMTAAIYGLVAARHEYEWE